MTKLWCSVGGVLAIWYSLSYLFFNWWGLVSAIAVTAFLAALFHYLHGLEVKRVKERK